MCKIAFFQIKIFKKYNAFFNLSGFLEKSILKFEVYAGQFVFMSSNVFCFVTQQPKLSYKIKICII